MMKRKIIVTSNDEEKGDGHIVLASNGVEKRSGDLVATSDDEEKGDGDIVLASHDVEG